jgi:hypothetical protein
MQTTVRHGFLLPEVTDDDPTPNAGVRDTTRFNSSLSDRSTFFDFNENITGRWSFPTITLTGGLSQDFVNNTGAARQFGDVVMLDPNVDRSIILPTALAVGPQVGVVVEDIAAGAVGRVAMEGFVRTKVTGITRLQYLVTQNASVIAAGMAAGTSAAFGIALENPSGGTALAYLHPSAGSDPESMYKGTSLRANTTPITAVMLNGKLYFFGYSSSPQSVVLPDPTLIERPITIVAEGPGTITVTATGGSAVFGGSTNLVTGAVQNGVIVAGDAYQYKSNGIQWRAA